MNNTMNQEFKNLVTKINERGDLINPRGLLVKELTVETLEIDPSTPIPNFTVKPFNWSYLLGEFAWYLQRDTHIDFIGHFSKFWQNIATPEGYINSNYGAILFDRQLEWAKDSLMADEFSRQAVCFVNSPRYQYAGNRDFVCTMYINFWIRDNQLNMKVQMRSNDVFYGLSYDAPFFAFVQQTMWHWLKDKYSSLELGTYYHCADNIHIYEKHFDVANKIVQQQEVDPSPTFLLREPFFNVKDGSYILLPAGQKFLEDVNELVRENIENPEHKMLASVTKPILQKYFLIK